MSGVAGRRSPPAWAAIAGQTVLEAIGNRLIWLTAVFLLLGFLLSEFLAQVVLTETRQFQAAFLAAVLRVSATVVVATFVVTSTLREFQEKGVELVLSLPIPRWVYLAGKLLGFAAVGGAIAIASTAVVMVYAPWTQSLIWGISLGCELLIVIAFCMLCLLTFNQVTSALFATGLFYVAARTVAALQLMAHGPLAHGSGRGAAFIDGFIAVLAFLLPDLSAFTVTDWLVYRSGQWADLAPVLVQTVVYLVLLVGASLFDLHRKVF